MFEAHDDLVRWEKCPTRQVVNPTPQNLSFAVDIVCLLREKQRCRNDLSRLQPEDKEVLQLAGEGLLPSMCRDVLDILPCGFVKKNRAAEIPPPVSKPVLFGQIQREALTSENWQVLPTLGSAC